MANTTFNGPVRSQNGFQSISIDSTTGAVTVNSTFDTGVVLGNQNLSGAGAVDITNALTSLTTTGASQALTLADGTVGEMKAHPDRQVHPQTDQHNAHASHQTAQTPPVHAAVTLTTHHQPDQQREQQIQQL